MSVKEFIRRLSFKKSKSKKTNTGPAASQWASTQGLSGNHPNSAQSFSAQGDLGPPSMRSAQSQPALTQSFSTFAAAAAASPSPTKFDHNNGPAAAPLSDWIYEDIVLERRGRGLGFTLAGGIDRNNVGDGGIYVTKILPGGVAEHDGRLKVNDTILSVNETSFVGLTHREAVDVLKATPNTVYLKVKRFRQATDSVTTIELYRPQGKGLGLMIAGGIGSQEFDGDDGIFIMKITDGGVADRDGRLAVGDRLLAVNDLSMTYLSHEEAVDVLMNVQGVVKLVIAKASSNPQRFSNAGSSNIGGHPGRPAVGVGYHPSTSSYKNNNNGDMAPSQQYRTNAFAASPSAAMEPSAEASSIRGRSTPAAVQTQSPMSPPPLLSMSFAGQSPQPLQPSSFTYQSTSAQPPLTELIPRVMTGSDIPSFVKEEREIFIRKNLTAGLGFNIVGGVGGCGIFISAIVPGGVADLNGKLRKGDQLLSVNGVDLREVTHLEATAALKAVGETALIKAQYRPEEFNRLERQVREHQQLKTRGQPQIDEQAQVQPAAQFIRALFDYDASTETGPGRILSFSFGDILHVVNASPADDWWQARRVLPWSDVNSSSGLIPSRRRVEMKFVNRIELPPFDGRADAEPTKASSGNKRRRSFILSSRTPFGKSKEKLHVEDENNRHQMNAGHNQNGESNFPTASYETVVQVQSKMTRPVIIFGPLKDRINDDLVAEFPNKFSSCVPHTTRPIRQGEVDGRDYHFVRSKETMERDIKNGLFVEAGVYNDHLYGMSAESIKHVATQGKHCLLDVSTGAIPRLQVAGIYPIAILIKPKTPSHISLWNQPISDDASKKVYAATVKLFNEYGQFFTAVASAESPADIYDRVKQVIEEHSQSLIWITSSEKLP